MKKLRFKEISFLSYSSRKARRISLDADIVIIKGDTDTGKSCITKSLYTALGTSIKSIPETWKKDNIVVLLKFSIDDINYTSLHIGKDYYIFNPDGTQRTLSGSLAKQGKAISNLLDIHLPKIEVNGIKQTFYSDYLFMPFYIDQDDGWSQPWTSFSKSGGTTLRANTLLLHTGVVSDEYFSLKVQLDNAVKSLDKVKSDLAANSRLVEKMKKRLLKFKLSLNENDFNVEIANFIKKISELKIAQKNKLVELKELYNRKSYLTFCIEQLHNNIKEIDKDFNYAMVQEDIITCPMCGSRVNNDFLGRLEMREDIVKCKDLIIQYENELKEINHKIDDAEGSNKVIRDKLMEISQLMQIKKDESSLDDYLNSKLEIYFDGIMGEEKDRLQKEKVKYQQELECLKARVNDDGKKERKKMIENDFGKLVLKYTTEMKVHLNSEKKIPLSTNISVTGTKVPRTIVAYTYAFIEIMCKYGGPILCPIVVDEMRQRGLRDKDEETMFSFLVEKKPKDAQLVVATSSDLQLNGENIKVVELNKPNNLLIADEFLSVSYEIDDLLYDNFTLRN